MVKNHERRDSHSEVTNRNDPGRFFGDGVVFKAKLIGILEVGEARGDRMCQEALQDLKMAIRAAGEHKQRITIHVTLDGLRLRDEKTGDSLYHHPVHKISFIAQDMTDSRAFGYIFGSPDSGHRFFGIKTDKAASQVVLAMRDLFQVVFELKKKEIEMARQQIQSKTIHEHQPIALTVKNATAEPSPLSYNKSLNESSSSKSNAKEMSPESVADLVDLEQELSSLQRGITQMERITPNEPPTTAKSLSEEDPFGDSFTSFPTYNLLPPPESSRSRHSKPVKPPDTTTATTTTTIPDVSIPSFTASQTPSSAAACVATTSSGSMTATSIANSSNLTRTSDNWLEHGESIPFDSQTPKSHGVDGQTNVSSSGTSTARTTATPPTTGGGTTTGPGTTSGSHLVEDIQLGEDINAFTDLDPLGTGKSKPYIDKKYFFQELKNPPKKVLKDLSGQDGASFQATFSGGNGVDSIDKTDIFADKRSTSDSYDVVHHHQPPPSLTSHSTTTHGSGPSSAGLTSMTSSSNASNRLPDTKPLDFISPKVFPQTNLERAKLEEPVMIPRDTDPFSPTRKKSDPFQEGDIFSKLDPFEFDFGNRPVHTEILPDTKITNDECTKIKRDANVFNGPLQVSLPPESWTSTMAQKKIERQSSESPTSATRNRPSVFKQNTVDVISSISSKKMPHLFGQKFSKRDSNSINMRRLQESDSLSENETAPEPPPRPESASHIEPPPLPPKKQFSDIVIRPRITSSSAIPPPMRYDYVTSRIKSTQSLDSAPPIPLPSRKIGRTDSSYPGPGRPGRKPGGEEEDYLTPITTSRGDVPPLLPPPQTKSRGRRLEHVEHNKTEIEASAIPPPLASRVEPPMETIIPDITLSQLLTLGIDDLAVKLNVPTSKLNTMTLVELTTYLSEFIENSKKSPKPPPKRVAVAESAVFKVNFDQNSDATFVAKFDDNFGEDTVAAPFVANFSNFDAMPEQPTSVSSSIASVVPSADRYAVFREIMEQDGTELSSSLEKEEDSEKDVDKDGEEESPEPSVAPAPIQVAKIDTKITEVISQAKDRYAALRDIILVEDLFEKSVTRPTESFSNSDLMEEAEREEENDVFHDIENEKSANEESSPENNQRFRDSLETTSEIRQTPEIRQNGTLLNKDDFEIDELMNRAISNLSLNSRENLSPTVAGMTKSPAMAAAQNASTSPIDMQQSKSPNNITTSQLNQIAPMKSQFNDMSTSPIPQQKSPAQKSPMNMKSPLTKSPVSKSPLPQSPAVTSLIDASKRANSGSLSDVVCGSSPEADAGTSVPDQQKSILTPSAATTESWAIFDQPVIEKKMLKSPKGPVKELAADSPCSSDGKDDWNKGEPDYNKRWPKGQTSSSSRDLSPWDDEAPDYKKRPGPPGTDRHGYYMRHARRMNSCDDDYEYEEEISKRRERRGKSSLNRSRENFDSDSQNWYHPSNHHNWSPPEDDNGRPRTFDRGAYERSTYGPPYDKRDHKGSCIPYDGRRNYKNYEKRKYYREYSRPDYDFESYGESPDVKDRKLNYYGDSFEKPKVRRDYENIYEDEFSRESRSAGHKSRGEYYYDRDRKSFDRESVESYESTGRRHKSFGSGDVYGSLDSREEFRERYMGAEKTRSLRKGIKMRGTEEYEQDSENDVQVRRPPGDTRSLQRPPQCTRIRKSSGSSPWDGEEIPPPPSAGQKGWKRPSSASESERRLAENLRVFSHTLSGSDGEKDRRFRKKPRSRGGKDIGTVRYAPHRGDPNYDYIGYEDYEQPMDEDKFERLNRRRQDMHQRMMESERRKKGDKFGFDDDDEAHPKQQQQQLHISKKDSFYSPSEKERCYASHKFDAFDEPPKSGKSLRKEFDFDDFEETPRSNTSSGKFNFEEHGGFESDFNSPPPTNPGPPPSTASATKSSFRFSNDFSDKEKSTTVYDSEVYNQTPTQKLRFDEKVTVSKFESDSHGAFEDDFSKAEFLFENEDQWTNELPKKNSLRLSKRQENIKKSESVNIFAKKSEDPFEDDDFFNSTTSPGGKDELTSSNGTSKRNSGNGNTSTGGGGNGSGVADSNFQWDNNFAKFDENM